MNPNLEQQIKQDFRQAAKLLKKADPNQALLLYHYLTNLAEYFDMNKALLKVHGKNTNLATQYAKALHTNWIQKSSTALKSNADFHRQICSAVAYEDIGDTDITATIFDVDYTYEVFSSYLKAIFPEFIPYFEKIQERNHIFMSKSFGGFISHPVLEKDYICLLEQEQSFLTIFQLVSLFGQFIQENSFEQSIENRLNYESSLLNGTFSYYLGFLALHCYDLAYPEESKFIRQKQLYENYQMAKRYLELEAKKRELSFEDIPGEPGDYYIRHIGPLNLPARVSTNDPHLISMLYNNNYELHSNLSNVYSFLAASILCKDLSDDLNDSIKRLNHIRTKLGQIEDFKLLSQVGISEQDLIHQSLNLTL